MVSVSNLLNSGLLLISQNIYQDVATPQELKTDGYNILNFLGGSAPYISRESYGIDPAIPDGCTVQQVQLFSRHGERYPSKSDGKSFEAINDKFKQHNGTFKGDLYFLNDYTYFVKDKQYYEKETSPKNSEGTFAGTTDALRHGAFFRSKYGSLYNVNSTLPVFSSNSGRVTETARYFARGFLGDDFNEGKSVKFNIIDEADIMGVNTLTPKHACPKYNSSANDALVKKYNTSYLQVIADRLNKPNPGLNLTSKDVSSLFSWCAYEINVRGKSQVCDLFTNEEFIKNSYAQDLSKFYSNSMGNELTRVMGAPLLNASLALLKDNSEYNKIWLSFSHDTDLEIYHSALGILLPPENLTTDYIPFPNPYVHSSIVPQGARIYTEKYQCGSDSYVRYIINDAVVPIPKCATGPGFSCKLSDFETYINSRIGDIKFAEQCGLNSSVPQHLTFYYDYNTTTYNITIIGSTLLNASSNSLNDESRNNKIWLSFTNDTDLEIYHIALSFLEPANDLPTDHVAFPRSYLQLYHKGIGQNIYQDVATPQELKTDGYNILNFLGGSAPYISRESYGIDPAIPDGCIVQQVQLFSRHGERYPSKGNGVQYEGIYSKFKQYNGTFNGDLHFLNDYTYFVQDKQYYEKETSPKNSEGTFAGTTDALRHGAFFRSKYGTLYNVNSTLPVFSSNSGRCYETSRYFARGFLGDDFNEGKTVKFNIIDEAATSGANSLTPRNSCPKYNSSANKATIAKYNTSFLTTIADRLNKPNPGLKLNGSDVNGLFSWCAFEINVRGSSPVCDLFTNEEFIKYSYSVDLNNYYSNGGGNNFTTTIGATLLNASLALLKDNANPNKIWLSFSHDTDLEIYHAALGLLEPANDLPTDYIPFPNPYVHSSIVPQGARIYTEKYQCGVDSYVRYIINDAVVPIPKCATGPGFSCKLSDFEGYINERIGKTNFDEQCGLNSSVPQHVTFYQDYKNTTYNATLGDF
ncbi:PHO5 [Candida jiufengensis]|uniref:PHO5 n=1 Tax=Candida jiufengensis TaxID=497108 RepID=UPI0022258CE0|nr:PHO5 [Candida jiufengensis]KAI5950885.1 PHO5 [Candida jiufengensis]